MTETTDHAALRERIVAAVEYLHDTGGVYALEPGEAGRIADAVLPEATRLHDEILTLRADLAKLRDLLRTENKRANDAITRETTTEEAEEEQRLALSQALGLGTGAPWDAIRDRSAELGSVLPAPAVPVSDGLLAAQLAPLEAAARDGRAQQHAAIRAAALTEAADFLRNAHFDEGLSVQEIGTAMRHWADRERADAASGPGRVAGETQQPETQDDEAHPAEHAWAAELYDPLAEQWSPGTRYSVRERAVNHLNHARTIGPTWKDGTPTQRRLVRTTTTYTVEAEQPAAVSQPETEA